MYRFLGLHFSFWMWLLWPLRFFMKLDIKPAELTKENFQDAVAGRDVVYILPQMTVIDVFAVNLALKRLGMPRIRMELNSRKRRSAALLAIKRRIGFLSIDRRDSFSEHLASVIKADPRVSEEKLVLVPVSAFWSRAAERTNRNAILRILFPDEQNATSLQKILLLFFEVGNISVHFGQVLSFAEAKDFDTARESQALATAVGASVMESPAPVSRPPESISLTTVGINEFRTARRIRRRLLIHFSRERAAFVGPTLYEFSSVANWVLRSREVQRLTDAKDPAEKEKNQRKAMQYLREIAANFSHTTVRAFEFIFDFLWTRIFKGVRVRNFENVAHVAKAGQIVWMPCHRSHLDYLLLSYVLYKKGLVPPHIVAGVNLSFWPAGPILRRGGAFFIRRSIAGNKLYAQVFSQYLHFLLHNSFPLEFFHEGGRSRIGKLLSPKIGTTSMCVSSILRRKAQDTYIVPVYFGYDKVMEDSSYARELGGSKKSKESMWQLIGAFRHLFKNYGRVDVSFGAPIHFGTTWKEYFSHQQYTGRLAAGGLPVLGPEIEELPDEIDSRDPQIQSFVKALARRVNQNINAAATASGSALLTSVLLSLTDHSFTGGELRERLRVLHWTTSRLARLLGWAVGPSLASEEQVESEAFVLSQRVAEEGNGSLSKDTESASGDAPKEVSPVVAQPLLEKRPLDSIVEEILSDGCGFEFLKITEVAGEKHFERNREKDLNLWWYRGTIFHVLAIPGLVASFLLELEHDDRDFNRLVTKVAAVRHVWDEELFWPETTSTGNIVTAALTLLSELNCLKISDNFITLNEEKSAQEHLSFFAALVQPERELYGLQIFTAVSLLESHGTFTREELVRKTTEFHRTAFLRGAATVPANLSKVFGSRTFDALYRAGIFCPEENQKLGVSFTQLVSVSEFFDSPAWRSMRVEV